MILHFQNDCNFFLNILYGIYLIHYFINRCYKSYFTILDSEQEGIYWFYDECFILCLCSQFRVEGVLES